MAVPVQECFGYKQMSDSGALLGSGGGALAGFLCTTSGTLKLTVTDGAGATIVDTCTVTAGVFLPLPFTFTHAVYATLAGGAVGTFAVA